MTNRPQAAGLVAEFLRDALAGQESPADIRYEAGAVRLGSEVGGVKRGAEGATRHH
jgi:hypothetical protein